MELSIEKLVSGGQGLAKKDGKTYLVWNALPGETARVKIVNKARSVYEAIAQEILSPSPDRVSPEESHHLSCSPWQIMTFEAENRWKENIASETYGRLGGIKTGGLSIVSNPNQTRGYRNKIEYGFYQDAKKLSFSFFERNSHRKNPVTSCALASGAIQEASKRILSWLQHEGLPEACLKQLVIRSGDADTAIAGLFLNEDLGIKSHPDLEGTLKGFQIFFGEKKVLSAGEDRLKVSLNGTPLSLGLFSFFQINPPLFEKTLKDMTPFLDNSPAVVDLYSGVGAIGISLRNQIRSGVLVDENEEAIAYAKRNIRLNDLKNFEAIHARAENITRLIQSDRVLIMDPPRSGLDSKVIRRIIAEKPPRILYLSCDIATHARDLALLRSAYRLEALKLYNYFPRTPHIESLAILEKS